MEKEGKERELTCVPMPTADPKTICISVYMPKHDLGRETMTATMTHGIWTVCTDEEKVHSFLPSYVTGY